MTKYPAVQRKVQEELDEVIGKENAPVIADRKRLPYTDSVLNEILRFGTILPAVTRRTSRECTFRGYHIPKGAYIFANLTIIFRDPQVWADPEHFNPEANFPLPLGNPKKVAERCKLDQQFIPFGMGKRVCLGKNLVEQEYFLVFTHLLHKFTITSHPGHPLPSEYQGTAGLTRGPLPFEVCFLLRK